MRKKNREVGMKNEKKKKKKKKDWKDVLFPEKERNLQEMNTKKNRKSKALCFFAGLKIKNKKFRFIVLSILSLFHFPFS